MNRFSFPAVARCGLGIVGLGLFGAVATSACKSSNDAPLDDGVNDVKAACELRASWVNIKVDTCQNCLASAAQAACDCVLFKEFGGKCHPQDLTRQADAECTYAVSMCRYGCATTDCACIDNCYAMAASCKQATAAVDGCVADVCAPYCQ